MEMPDGWTIQLSAKPIPTRAYDYDFWHKDNCDTEVLCGTAFSELDALDQIEDFELTHPYFNEEK